MASAELALAQTTIDNLTLTANSAMAILKEIANTFQLATTVTQSNMADAANTVYYKQLSQTDIDTMVSDLNKYRANIADIVVPQPAYDVSDIPPLPSTVNMDGSVESVWKPEAWSDLKTLVQGITTAMDTSNDLSGVNSLMDALGGSETVRSQVNLYKKDYERRSQTLRDLYSAAHSNTGAKGFLYPNSMTVALKLDAQQKFQMDGLQMSREIQKYIFDWAKTNFQWAVTEQKDMQKLEMDFAIKYHQALIDAYKGIVDGIMKSYMLYYDAQIKKIEALGKRYNAELEAYKLNADIAMAGDKTKIAIFEAYVREKLGRIQLEYDQYSKGKNTQITAAAEAVKGVAAIASAVSSSAISITQQA